MREVDSQAPDLSLFAGARYYRGRSAVTAVRLDEPLVVVSLLGREEGQAGDYLCRDPKTGRAWIVGRGLFEATYFVERELDGATRAKSKGMVIA